MATRLSPHPAPLPPSPAMATFFAPFLKCLHYVASKKMAFHRVAILKMVQCCRHYSGGVTRALRALKLESKKGGITLFHLGQCPMHGAVAAPRRVCVTILPSSYNHELASRPQYGHRGCRCGCQQRPRLSCHHAAARLGRHAESSHPSLPAGHEGVSSCVSAPSR